MVLTVLTKTPKIQNWLVYMFIPFPWLKRSIFSGGTSCSYRRIYKATTWEAKKVALWVVFKHWIHMSKQNIFSKKHNKILLAIAIMMQNIINMWIFHKDCWSEQLFKNATIDTVAAIKVPSGKSCGKEHTGDVHSMKPQSLGAVWQKC